MKILENVGETVEKKWFLEKGVGNRGKNRKFRVSAAYCVNKRGCDILLVGN
jgi:hypothetical protein